jgi:hypothetical protein
MAVTSKDLRNNTRLSSGRPLPVPPRVGVNSMMYLITGLLALLALYAVMGNVVELGAGTSRRSAVRHNAHLSHAQAVVGSDDSPVTPSHFVAMNLNRQVVIFHIPGGDSAKTRVITGPYLFGAGEDKTPVLLDFVDLNNDGALDMRVMIKNEAIVYLNRGGNLEPISAEEYVQLMLKR